MTDRKSIYRAVLQRLQTGLINTEVHQATVEEKPPRMYAVLYPGVSPTYTRRLAGFAESMDWFCSVMCVGSSSLECLDVIDQVDNLLNGWDPDPSNLSMAMLWDDGVNAPILDSRVGVDLRFSGTKFYRLTTDRR